MRVKECQEGDDDKGKENLGEVQCENPSGHMLHPVYSISRCEQFNAQLFPLNHMHVYYLAEALIETQRRFSFIRRLLQ